MPSPLTVPSGTAPSNPAVVPTQAQPHHAEPQVHGHTHGPGVHLQAEIPYLAEVTIHLHPQTTPRANQATPL